MRCWSAITRLRVGGYIAWHASRWFSQWHQLQLELGSWFSDLVVSCYLATTLLVAQFRDLSATAAVLVVCPFIFCYCRFVVR